MAAPRPRRTERARAWRPVLRRYARRIPTTRAASIPSRRVTTMASSIFVKMSTTAPPPFRGDRSELHLALELQVIDIPPAARRLLEQAAREEPVEPDEEREPFRRLVRAHEVRL